VLGRVDAWRRGLFVRVRVLGAVAARHGAVLAVAAGWARRQVLRRAHLEFVAALCAAICAGGNVAACWNRIRHRLILLTDEKAGARVAAPAPDPYALHAEPLTWSHRRNHDRCDSTMGEKAPAAP